MKTLSVALLFASLVGAGAGPSASGPQTASGRQTTSGPQTAPGNQTVPGSQTVPEAPAGPAGPTTPGASSATSLRLTGTLEGFDAKGKTIAVQADAGTACWGAAVLGLALAKLIRRVEFVVSDRPERHGCHIGLWTLAISHADADRWLATHAELHGGTGAEPDDGEAGAPAPNPDASPSPTPFLAHPTLF